MPKHNITNADDMIDVRDVIERFEELADERQELVDACDKAEEGEGPLDGSAILDAAEARAEWDCENGEEWDSLSKLLKELKGQGGDEQWRGDWYPVTLIRDSHFRDYAQEMAEECAPYSSNSKEMAVLQMWPYRCIDWEQAARELRMDYTAVDFDGVTYWTR